MIALLAFADPASPGWTGTLSALRAALPRCSSFEEAANEVTSALYASFSAETALARVYAVVPFRELDAEVASQVQSIAVGANEGHRILTTTPVLTLFGTHGAKPEWCDRHASAGHAGIPLLSASFVQGIPMVARLLKELGVDVGAVEAAPSLNVRSLMGAFNGLFHVEDAATARDAAGRLIIPAQDFVAEQGVRSVFGLGGVYPDGTLVVIIVFSRQRLRRSDVDRHTALLSLVKGETFGLVRSRRFFAAQPSRR